MTILALDAALGGFSVALDRDGTLHAEGSQTTDALERGLARIDGVLRAGGVRLRDLDRIAVGIGPGSFTGVRIAISYAKSLAQASGVPLVGISSYDALEPAGAAPPVLAVVRGRSGVVCARLRAAGTVRTACGPTGEVLDRLLTPGDPIEIAVAGDTEGVRSGIAERGLTLRELPPRARLPAIAIAELARSALPAASPHALAPDYGEAPAVSRPRARGA